MARTINPRSTAPGSRPHPRGAGPGHVEATQRDDHEIRRKRGELAPGARSGALPRTAGRITAPGDLDQLGNPVPRDVRRVEPFQNQDTWGRGASYRTPRRSWGVGLPDAP